MPPECISAQLEFEGLDRRSGVGRSDGDRLAMDGGVQLVPEVDHRFRVTEHLAGCSRYHLRTAASTAVT